MTRHTSQDCRTIQQLECTTLKKKTKKQKKTRFSATAFCCFVPILPVAVVLEFHTSLLQRLCRVRAFPNSMVFKGFGIQIGYLFLATLVMHKARAPDKTCFFSHSILELGVPGLKEVTFLSLSLS